MTKTDAAAQTLSSINPDVSLESFTMNITTVEGFERFKASLTAEDGTTSRVDLVLSCVDNYEARITINQAGAQADISWCRCTRAMHCVCEDACVCKDACECDNLVFVLVYLMCIVGMLGELGSAVFVQLL